VQISTDNTLWREVWTGNGEASAHWQTSWEMPAETAQGQHTVRVRGVDRAGNWGDILTRTIIVDVQAPTSELTDRGYLQDPPLAFAAGNSLDFHGTANDAGRAPQPSHPTELAGSLDGLNDATIWLALPNITDDDQGVSVVWAGAFNGDRLADLLVAAPAAAAGRGELTLINGSAGGWPTPLDAQRLSDSATSFRGASGAGLGSMVAAAGDVNGDGFDDLLVGDPHNNRAFLIFGQAAPLGRDRVLDGPNAPAWSLIDLAGLGDLHGVAAAGDVNGDGFDDLLFDMAGSGRVYLLLGQRNPWWERIPLDEKAAAVIDVDSAGAVVNGVHDMDGDQNDEFAIASGGTVYLFAGRDDFLPGAGEPHESLTLSDAISTFGSANNLPAVSATGDVNGDGLADFLYQNGGQPQLVFGDSGRNWTTQALDFSPAASGFLAAPGDVDGDGRADILAGNADGDAYLILGKDASSVQATLSDVKAAASARYPAAADLNADGSSDLLLVPGAVGSLLAAGVDYGPAPPVAPPQLPQAPERWPFELRAATLSFCRFGGSDRRQTIPTRRS